MKYILSSIVIFTITTATSIVDAKRIAPDYFSHAATIVQVGTNKDNHKLPLIIFLPATDMTAEKLFLRMKSNQPYSDYIALIPAGKPKRSEYQTDFRSYLLGYERNLLHNIQLTKKNYPIDDNKIFVQGFSLGGDLARSLMVRNKDLFAGATIISSRMSYPIRQDDINYFATTHKHISLLIGDRDDATRIQGMKNKYTLLKKGKTKVLFASFSGAHELPDNDLSALAFIWMSYRE